MNLASSYKAFSFFAALACGVLLATACLTPPPTKASSAEAGAPSQDAMENAGLVDPGPRAFEHTSVELIKSLNIGWNLGNSLDVPDGETAWGNPEVSPELLQAVAKAGFDLVRIPVTWTKHTGPAPEYTIEPSWLARVEEVVGYARAAGVRAIINLHHDGADGLEGAEWLTLNDKDGQTTKENNDLVRTRYVAAWKQIARHFAGHGEELLFESMNEIHDGYGKADPRHMEFINELNEEFVKLVRASGGNNDKRHLVVPGYNTNIDHTLEGFKLPKDPTPDRLILSVHYYDPYLFALQAKTTTWGNASPGKDDWGQEDFVVKQFDRLKAAYIDKGLPVIIGEYGATNNEGFEEYRRYYMEYVTKAAVDRGIVPVYWDNGGRNSGGENFGMFDRQADNVVLHPTILEAMMRAATKDYTLSDVKPPRVSK